jgi:hypothetical protein
VSYFIASGFKMATDRHVILLALFLTLITFGGSVRNCYSPPKNKLPAFVTATVMVGGSKDTVVNKLKHGGIKMGIHVGCDNGQVGFLDF